MKKAVYFFCMDRGIDPVASSVFESIIDSFSFKETDRIIDDFPVYEILHAGNLFSLVRLNSVLSHDYVKYIPLITPLFSDYDFSGIVNWHQGANAPDPILCAHTTGDINSGIYGKAHPLYFRNLLHAMETRRLEANLLDFKTMTEATHWSGVMYQQAPELIIQFPVPIVDIEIGSYPYSWGNKIAASVLGKAIFDVFDSTENNFKSLLCVGGVHFEDSFSEAMMNKDNAIAVSHIIANQWIVSGEYETAEGLNKLKNCIESIIGGIDAIVFHDNIKGIYKEQCRILGQEYNIPVFKKKLLKDKTLMPI